MRLNQGRRGVILLDIILGTTLLVIAGVAFATLLWQNVSTVDQLRRREREIAGASEHLERMAALWSAPDFAAHRGTFSTDAYVASIDELAPSLYRVSIADSASGVVLLRTTIYAADPNDASR